VASRALVLDASSAFAADVRDGLTKRGQKELSDVYKRQSWVHLRICLTCGHVGCCDSSKNKHATKHFHSTRHPMMRSLEPGEDWGWCFVDEIEYDLSRGVKHAEVME